MNEPPESPEPPSRAPQKDDAGYGIPRQDHTGKLLVFVGITLIMTIGYMIIKDMMVETRNTIDLTSKKIAAITKIFDDFAQVTPRLEYENKVILQQTAPIAELAVVEKEFEYIYTWKQEWLRSRKSIKMTQKFKVKAGFDLTEPFIVRVAPDTGEVFASLPAAKTLSVEPIGELKQEAEHGYWNLITDEEREQVVNEYYNAARDYADKKIPLKEEAEAQATTRLQELTDRNSQQMLFEFRKIESVTEEATVGERPTTPSSDSTLLENVESPAN